MKRFGKKLSFAGRVVLVGALLLGNGKVGADDISANSSAYGLQVNLTIKPIGLPIPLTLASTPRISGSAPPQYSPNPKSNYLAQASVLGLSTVVSTGALTVLASSNVPNVPDSNTVGSDATVNDTNIGLGSLSIHVDVVESKADVGGACGQPFTTIPETKITNLRIGDILTVQLDPETGLWINGNQVLPVVTSVDNLLNLDLVKSILSLTNTTIKLNERILTADGVVNAPNCNGARSCKLETNALHIILLNLSILTLVTITGDIIISHSEAELNVSKCVQRKYWQQIM